MRYAEGDWFAVPLIGGGYAIGICARCEPTGGVLGYFFGPRRTKLPSGEELAGLTPQGALSIQIFGDLGLLKGRWPIIGHFRNFSRSKWPIPKFARKDLVSGELYLVEYTNDLREMRSVRSTASASRGKPEDGVSGYGAVEIVLSDLLKR